MGGYSTSFAPCRRCGRQLKYGGTFTMWDFGWNYLNHKTWYRQKLQSVEMLQLGAKAIVMATKQNKTWIILDGITPPL